MNRLEALDALARQRVARLATTRPDGRPHVVPITFSLCGDRVVTMIDHKPKSTSRLQRLANIEASPPSAILADHYSDDWSSLWWVRVDGRGSIHHDDESWAEAREALAEKYSQYRQKPPRGPAIVVSMDRVSWWESTP